MSGQTNRPLWPTFGFSIPHDLYCRLSARSVAQRRRRVRERTTTSHGSITLRPFTRSATTAAEEDGHEPGIEFPANGTVESQDGIHHPSSFVSPTPSRVAHTQADVAPLSSRPLPSTRAVLRTRSPSNSPSHSTSGLSTRTLAQRDCKEPQNVPLHATLLPCRQRSPPPATPSHPLQRLSSPAQTSLLPFHLRLSL